MANVVADIKTTADGFFRWWFSELAAIIPRRISRLFRSRGGRLEIDFLGDTASLVYKSDGQEHHLGGLNVTDAPPGMQKKVFSSLVSKVRRGKIVTILRLPQSKALQKRMILPMAAAENLREVLGFEMDRQTPFKPENVYYDGQIVESDPHKQQIVVEITVVPRDVVDETMRRVASWEINPDRVGVVQVEEPARRIPLNLLPNGSGGKSSRFKEWLASLFMIAALGLALVAVFLPLQQKQNRMESIAGQVEAAKKGALEVNAMRSELKAIVGSGQFLVEQHKAKRPMTLLLHELTQKLPDDSWINSLRVSDLKVSVSGYAKSASALIGVLESSPMISNVEFSAPVTQDTRLGVERFSLKFTITPVVEK
ncbi:MAG: PilN domain-containing protein [Rhodospirillales bacterium]|nr:PilN domain-containing protein [Rhodospirillales bacterium]